MIRAAHRFLGPGWSALAVTLVIAAVLALVPMLSSATPVARCPAGHGLMAEGADCGGGDAVVSEGAASCCPSPAGLPVWRTLTAPERTVARHAAAESPVLVAIDPAAADPPPRRAR